MIFKPSFRRSLARAERFPIDVVLYDWCRQSELSWYDALRHERELKRFLVMRGVYPDQEYMSRGMVLRLWQLFITYTVLYDAFCQRCFGQYVHHWPLNTELGRSYPRAYADFHEDYQKYFREPPPPDIWPEPSGWTAEDRAIEGEVVAERERPKLRIAADSAPPRIESST